ncbi:uncharacterized protein LOC105736097 [Apis florea]|uniref:uncharacterized protein LOC105736097 n=1 Tax=Apis florea TaxID=7463 RepID=UPI0012FF52DA|nr:uncharacterized protein LOC105736097 [Apis florea]
MRPTGSRDISIIWTSFLMKIVGLWLAADRCEQRRRDFALIYTVGALFIIVCIGFRDIYFTWGNFSDSVYISCNNLYLMIVVLKVSVLYAHKMEFFNLVTFTRKNFWRPYRDPEEKLILAECKRICTIFVVVISFCAQGTCTGYMVTPIIANIGKNESNRELPFNLWVDFPVGLSPYFEILFTIQILCVYHVGVCYICFDNLLCIVNLHVAGQFRILQHRLRSLSSAEPGDRRDARKLYAKLKSCVLHHQALTKYCKQLENIFTIIVLGQVLFLAVVICLVGFQLFLMDTPASRKVSLVLNFAGTLCQLLMFTYSCDDLIQESVKVGNAIFSGPWASLPMDEVGRVLRKNLVIVIMRSHRVCCLTAGKFFPVSLETSTAVITTVFFLLVKQIIKYSRVIASSIFFLLRLFEGMTSKKVRDLSITVMTFYMKIVGFWLASNYVEERRRNLTISYTFFAVFFAMATEARDLYFTWGNFSDSILIICNLVTVILVLFKISISLVYKSELLKIIQYAKTNFWNLKYDMHEQIIVNTCKRYSTFFVCIFTFFSQGTVVSFVIRPLKENVGKNETERIHPFNLWLGESWYTTPYFEMVFIMEILSLYHVGVCYLYFDNFMCIINLHIAGQFRILQHRFSNVCNEKCNEKCCCQLSEKSPYSVCKYAKLKTYIRQHQTLIEYCRKLEIVSNLIIFGQVLLFSLLICLDGYLILMEDTSLMSRLIFTFHLTACMCQLLMFTYSCDCLIRDSTNVANATYNSLWSFMPMDKYGKMLRKDLILVIMRSKSPCYLTALGFFPVSLETYTSILSTAVSYFTLLRNQHAEQATIDV